MTTTPKLDDDTGALAAMPYDEVQKNAGNAFMVHLADTTLADTETVSMAFQTPAATIKTIRMRVQWSCRTPAHLDVLETASWTSGTGSTIAILNRARDSTTTSKLLDDSAGTGYVSQSYMVTTPTSLTGTSIMKKYSFTTTKSEDEGQHTTELTLKASTLYGVQLTADAGTSAGNLVLLWHEHLDR
ncbi:unnamed protein product [marine sediment metagenome]|uniref:Uncharacterized protein n=1 Tax=marine sediment metagenome TaxID=412755 RepID=X1DKV8_9ZZZZ